MHADTPTLLANQAAGNTQAQVEIYDRLTRRLQVAGARTVAVTSIAGHFCIDAFENVSVLPVINLLSVVDAAVGNRGYRRVGHLRTRGVMASTATCTEAQRQLTFEAGRVLVEKQGADAVLLAGTDLTLAFNGFDAAGHR